MAEEPSADLTSDASAGPSDRIICGLHRRAQALGDSGSVGEEEYADFRTQLSDTLKGEDSMDLYDALPEFAGMDLDGDGVLSLDEWREAFGKFAEAQAPKDLKKFVIATTKFLGEEAHTGSGRAEEKPTTLLGKYGTLANQRDERQSDDPTAESTAMYRRKV